MSASGITRGRFHPRCAGPLVAAHDATPLRPKKSPLYQREMNSENVWNSLVNGSSTSSNSTENNAAPASACIPRTGGDRPCSRSARAAVSPPRPDNRQTGQHALYPIVETMCQQARPTRLSTATTEASTRAESADWTSAIRSCFGRIRYAAQRRRLLQTDPRWKT